MSPWHCIPPDGREAMRFLGQAWFAIRTTDSLLALSVLAASQVIW